MVPFPKHPAGFYLISPSEFERFSLSARNVTEPLCCLEVSRLQDTSCLRWAVPGAHRNAGGLLCPPPGATSTNLSPCFLPATPR